MRPLVHRLKPLVETKTKGVRYCDEEEQAFYVFAAIVGAQRLNVEHLKCRASIGG
jgi:hypothetical protein